MNNNPYHGVSGSDDIKSNVMGLSLTGPDGKPLDLSGQTLTMFVKRDLSSDDTVASIYNFTKKRNGVTYHRFNFTSEENVMAIEMRPVQRIVSSNILIKKHVKPSLDDQNDTYVYHQPSKYDVTKLNKVRNSHSEKTDYWWFHQLNLSNLFINFLLY